MPFKPPLSFDELKAIQDRHPGDPDVKALLWEIKRLHAVVSCAHQFVRSVEPNPQGGGLAIISWALWHQIKDDPIVKQWQAFDTQPVEPGDED